MSGKEYPRRPQAGGQMTKQQLAGVAILALNILAAIAAVAIT